jgi:hypothetical protein
MGRRSTSCWRRATPARTRSNPLELAAAAALRLAADHVLQAVALLALCRIPFGGRGWGGGSRGDLRRRLSDRFADRVADRLNAMTPEERERFRQRLRERCGFEPLAGESKPG